MKNKKYFLFFIFYIFILFTRVYAGSKAGTSGGLLFRINPSALTAAVSDAVTARGENLAAGDINPAAFSNLPGFNGSFSHIEYFEDVNFEDLRFSTYLEQLKGNIALGLTYLYTGDVERDERGVRKDEFLNSVSRIGISYARKIYFLNAGLTVKYINEKLAREVAASAFAADFGILYINRKWPFDLGLSARNLGTKISFGGEKDELPAEFRLGLGRNYKKLFVAADAVWQRENVFLGKLGLELSVFNNLKLRGGWTTRQEYSLGLGALSKIISLDYSFTPHEELTEVHRFTLNAKF